MDIEKNIQNRDYTVHFFKWHEIYIRSNHEIE